MNENTGECPICHRPVHIAVGWDYCHPCDKIVCARCYGMNRCCGDRMKYNAELRAAKKIPANRLGEP